MNYLTFILTSALLSFLYYHHAIAIPSSPRRLTYKLTFKDNPMRFQVDLNWKFSPTSLVTGYNVDISTAGSYLPEVELGKDVNSYTFFIETEHTDVKVSVVATTGQHVSTPVVSSFTTPAFIDAVIPAPPTQLTYSLKVVD